MTAEYVRRPIVVCATPMTYGEFCKSIGQDCHESAASDPGYLVDHGGGFKNWSAASRFESMYAPKIALDGSVN